MTEQRHDPIFRTLDLSAEIRRIWGAKWNSPELAYRFGDREFFLRTEDASIYSGLSAGVGGGFILMEDGSFVLEEDDGRIPIEAVP